MQKLVDNGENVLDAIRGSQVGEEVEEELGVLVAFLHAGKIPEMTNE